MITIPGAATPTEAFAGIHAGASGVKVFPAEAIAPQVLASWRAVIPDTVPLLPVGGIDSDNMADYWQAGAAGFGLGSALYKPGKKPGGHRCQRNKTGLVRDFSYQDDVGKELGRITRINLLATIRPE